MKKINRSDAIQILIDNDIKSIVNGFNENDNSYANDIFMFGIKGYENLTNQELQTECNDVFFPTHYTII